MKGMLCKDWYLTKHNLKAFLVLIACFSLGGGLWYAHSSTFMLVYPGVMAAMLTLSLIGYDEREKWNVYCLGMPVSRALYVTEKYVCGLISVGTVLVFHGIGALLGVLTARSAGEEVLANMTLLLSVGLLGQALMMPFLFRFGVEKGRIAYALLFGMLVGGLVVISTVRQADGISLGNVEVSAALAAVAVCAASLAVYAISWRLSVALYQKREL